MSEESSYQYSMTTERLDAFARLAERARGVAQSCESARAQLDAYETALQAATSRGDLSARRAAMAQVPVLAAYVQAEEARQGVSRDVQAYGLRVNAAFERLWSEQSAHINRALNSALADMGYAVARPRGTPGARAWDVRAHRRQDNTTVVARVSDRRFDIDLSGFTGGACARVREQLERQLERHGVRLNVLVRNLHGCTAGGQLTSEAAAEGAAASTQFRVRN